MEGSAPYGPINHPAVMGSRCKKCGDPIVRDMHYVILKQMGKTSPKQDSVCLVCLGKLLLTSPTVMEALAEALLKEMDRLAARPSEPEDETPPG